MAEARPAIITLTTDFGAADHYAGAMKGAILSVAPQCVIVDISHEIPAHDAQEAGWVLRNAFASFPRRTVHLAVADPGVGSARRAILAVTENHYFVGPDNGIFSFVFEAEPPAKVVEISASHYVGSQPSPTFHARDIFAPVAAYLARGVDASQFGEPIEDYVRLDLPKPKVIQEGTVRAAVVHVDRFGNVILNLNRPAMEALMQKLGATGFTAAAGGRRIERTVQTYAEGPEGSAFFLFNSSGYLEIAANRGRASDLLSLKSGDAVELALSKA